MSDYLDKVKQIADHLSAAGRPVDHDDLVFYTLGGLGSENELLSMTVTSRITPITIDELHTLLLTHEHRLSITTQMASIDVSGTSPSKNLASRTSSDNRGQGRGCGQRSRLQVWPKLQLWWLRWVQTPAMLLVQSRIICWAL